MKLDDVTPQKTSVFGASFLSKLREMPFGAFSKGELEFAAFSALVESNLIDSNDPIFDLARALQCTPAKASALVFNDRLRSEPFDKVEWKKELAAATVVASVDVDKDLVVLNVENRFWRDALTNELKRQKVFTDTSFNRERITLDVNAFVEACDALFGEAGANLKREVKKASGGKKVAKQLQKFVATAQNAAVGVAVKTVIGVIPVLNASIAHIAANIHLSV